ncbi:hypothetical protein ACTJJ7_22150 [Phyllobacterium sp. 22229]|uniref:hypothetical protein n=1 Tax=Phyllobacterium TaxID=28100 RepID=UPI000D8E1543|nr:hypothetical protein [Phyllobacterium myrsinacearum]PWV95024.1 hypothetical protein DEV92_102485 [Phyllobacterium myrsinacearum]RZV06864.1 hypothetical protein EV654_1527 [Phyllobacterium myrsinacearum]
MRIALPLAVLSLMALAACSTSTSTGTTTGTSTSPKAAAAALSPAKDTHFVPPPKSLTQKAVPSKVPETPGAQNAVQ